MESSSCFGFPFKSRLFGVHGPATEYVASMKLQCDREQAAHLQTALLRPGGCGPRYEPLSRAPFTRRVWAQLPHAGLVEFTNCRSDLSMQLREHVFRGGNL